jgi:hypothetical protein
VNYELTDAEWFAEFFSKRRGPVQWIGRERKPAKVYFIRAETGQIKIGMAADPKARLSNLQTANPVKLELMATCEGGAEREAEYHERFREHHLRGEWFAPHEDILAEIARLSPNGKECRNENR